MARTMLKTAVCAATLAAVMGIAQSATAEEPATPSAPQEQKGPSINGKVDFVSRYVLRGIPYSAGAAVQPSISLGYKGLTFTAWGNYDHDARNMTEADLFVDYTRAAGKHASVSLGYNHIRLPHTGLGKTQEVYAGVSFDNPAHPAVTVFHDFDVGTGTALEAAVSHPFHFGKMEVDTSAVLGYNRGLFMEGDGSRLEAGVAIPIPLGKRVTLTPNVHTSKRLSGGFEDVTWGGIGIGIKLR